MAEALLSPILEQLSAVVAQQVREEVSLVGDVKKQVDKLKSNLLSIQSVLEDADRKQVKDKAVRDWVDKLKDVCYDMDDVLDEWSTAILRWKMEEAEENTRSLQKMRCSFLKSPCFCLNQVARRRDIARKIKEVCEKVDDIAKARDIQMAEALLSPILEQLMRIVAQEVQEEVNLVVGAKKQVDRLKSNLVAIQSVLEDADRKQVKDEAVKGWLEKLKDVCYNMDDVLDEWSTAILRWKMEEAEENTRSRQKMRCSFLKSPCSCLNQVVRRRDIALDVNALGGATVKTSIERVRHLSMMLSEETFFPKSIHKAKGLRSLLIHTRDPSLGAALPDLFKQLTCIRSLNLSESSIKEIPNQVGKLIHLRHLNLASCFQLESLPETMCDLCNLQSLDVAWCRSLKELPKAIGKLIKLRHIRIYGSGVAFIPKGIERITCLRTLDVFTVCCSGENESKAANLRELKNLNHIGGSLEIRNLGGGKEDASDAAEAQLKNKKCLLRLGLRFDREKTELQANEGSLIEALRPPSDLENLTINGYGGLHLPNWMMTLTRLQVLTLGYCTELVVFPPLGRLPNLERLVLTGLKVRRLDAGFLGIEKDENASIIEGEIARVTAFPKLKTLWILNLEEVEEWDGIERRVGEEDANTTSIISIMPQLQYLGIRNCPLLRSLPDHVLAAPLPSLRISGCPNLRKRYGKEVEMGEDWQKISHIPKIDVDDT
uniref:Rx N-terminal domain-containing protein n=2 Tax=Populus TaxID=3689 RepID=A0A4U5Q3A8_POPAL|nr:hypothetical protein D5086_0000143230 [Populus alba]